MKKKLGINYSKYNQKSWNNTHRTISQFPKNRENFYPELLQRANRNPYTLSRHDIMQMHKIVGNQSVGRIIQRAINPHDLDAALDMNGHFGAEALLQTNQEKRNREETRMLYEEFHLRYPANNTPLPLIDNVVVNLNQNPIITFPMVRQAITAEEVNLGIAVTTPVAVQPAANPALFIHLLEQRRGAYNWAAGASQAFSNWINGFLPPLSNPLSINAHINCWEAVLVSAALSGLVTIGQLRGSYLQHDIADGVFALITRNGTTVINHPAQGANNIAVGDIIMIDGADGILHHVVAAVTADADNYNNVGVMSLWNAIGGGGFTRTLLGNVLPENTTMLYSTL